MGLPIADCWFEKRRIDDDISLIFEPHVVPLMRCNIWHIRGRDRDLMIDTGVGISSLRTFARDFLDKPVTAVATHVHADHIGSHHEFDDCIVHPLEMDGLLSPSAYYNIAGDQFDANDMTTLGLPPIEGYDISGPMITALPHPDYDLSQFSIRAAPIVRPVAEGDFVDLGNRIFEIMHLPGHSPGGIGLWEKDTGTLFSGDSIYDGPLLDSLQSSNIPDYIRTFERLRELPVTVVHGGHDPSFGRDRLMAITEAHLRKWAKFC